MNLSSVVGLVGNLIALFGGIAAVFICVHVLFLWLLFSGDRTKTRTKLTGVTVTSNCVAGRVAQPRSSRLPD